MGAGKADLEEEGAVEGRGFFEPPEGGVADEEVGVHVLVDGPLEGAEGVFEVVAFDVGVAAGLADAPGEEGFVEFVVEADGVFDAVFVLDDVALVESEAAFVRAGVHLADVDVVVTGGGQIFDPGVGPDLAVAHDSGVVGEVTGEEAGAGGGADGGVDETVVEADSLADQAVDVGGVHVVEAEGVDGIETLLVGDDKDDVRSISHGPRFF